MRNKCGATTDEAISVPDDEGLISPADWPRALLHYTYSNSTGVPQLDLEFHLDGHGYIDQDGQAKRDLARYQQVCDQLRQDDADDGLPVAVGGAVTMQLSHSLLADPVHVLDEREAGVIRRFVADCVAYLTAVVDGTALPPAPSATLSQAITWTELAAGAWVELNVVLSLMRNPSTVDPGVATPAECVICPILPKPDGGDTLTTIAFARNFEAIFKNDAWKLRIGQNVHAQADDCGSAHRQQLWVMRFGADGIAFEIGETASYYAPRPIARTLVDRSVAITTYPDGDKSPVAFSRIDQNAWFHTALEALDALLAQPASSAVHALDQRLGCADPIADGYLGKVVAAKQSLADSISASAAPILSTSLDDASTQWVAQTALRQQLLAQLGPAYAAGVTVVFGLDHVTGGSGPLPARLYGQPYASLMAHVGKQNALWPASLPLGGTTVDGQTYAPRLAFATTIENNTERTYAPLALRYQITHLEFDRADVPGADGCPQSRRLSLVTGPIDVPLGNGTSNIPLCSRVVPAPSVSSLQTAEKSCSHPTTAEQLALWTYRVVYRRDQAVQDTARMVIEFNAADAPQSTPGAAASDLFDALAQFVSTYPGMAADFALSLPAIRSGNADDATIQLAHRAVAAFQTQITAIAAAHAAHATAHALTPAAPAAFQQRDEIAMTIQLDQAADGSALCVVTDLHINGMAATWNEAAGTMSNGAMTLPAVWVEMAPETYQAEPVKPSVANIDIAFRYRATDGAYLSFESARTIETRSVVIHGLDAMVHQNARSSCEAERNRVLVPTADMAQIKTRDDFILRAPATQHEAVMPRIEHAMFSLDDIAPPSAGIRDVLAAFYASLFKSGNGSLTTHVTMNPAYSYNVMAGGPRVLLPIAMMQPRETRVIPAPPPAFIESISSVITHWLANASTSGHEEPRLNFTVTLSTAREAQEPLLTIHDMSRSLAS